MTFEWDVEAATLTISREDKEILSSVLAAAPHFAGVAEVVPAERILDVRRIVQSISPDQPFRLSHDDFNHIHRILFAVSKATSSFKGAEPLARLVKALPGEVQKLTGEGVRSARFSLDDRWLLTLSRETAHLWDLTAGRPSEWRDATEFASFALGSDLWCRAGPVWRIWTGQEVEPHSGTEALLARNRRFALLRRRGSALLLDVERQEPVGAFNEPYPTEACVTLSPDGRRLLHSGTDSTACLRDAASGDLILKLEGHKSLVHTAAFSEDSRWAVTAGKDQTTRIWELRTGRWVAALHSTPGGAWMVIDPDLRYDTWDVTDADDTVWVAALGSAGWGARKGRYTPGLLAAILTSPPSSYPGSSHE